MSRIVLLDSGPLGLVTNPKASGDALRCNIWMEALLAQGIQVAIPEIADYEVRRELLRGNKRAGIRRLDALKAAIRYAPITTDVMLQAAAYWAQARNQGRQTADDKALDGDVILAAQAILIAGEEDDAIIATTNVGHLARFVAAENWWTIT